MCRGGHWWGWLVCTKLPFVVFLGPYAGTSAPFLSHQTASGDKHRGLGHSGALLLGSSRSVPECGARYHRARNEARQDDVKVADREEPIGRVRRTGLEIRPKIHRRVHQPIRGKINVRQTGWYYKTYVGRSGEPLPILAQAVLQAEKSAAEIETPFALQCLRIDFVRS